MKQLAGGSSAFLPFVQESVGQQLFLMVSALTQQIAKGPVDCVTEKALYTLSEDWLLWQAQDFSSMVHTHTSRICQLLLRSDCLLVWFKE